MAQLGHVTAGDQPVDLTIGLADGCYVAQSTVGFDGVGLLYASAESAPADDADYFQTRGVGFFVFTVGDDAPPTWVKSPVAGSTQTVSLALVPDP